MFLIKKKRDEMRVKSLKFIQDSTSFIQEHSTHHHTAKSRMKKRLKEETL